MKKLLLIFLACISAICSGQTPIYQYNFNGSLSDANEVNTLTSSSNTVLYVADRNGNATSAIKLLDVELNTNLSNLPQDNSARTISYWFKSNFISSDVVDINWMFVYGSPGSGFGLYSEVYLINGFPSSRSRNYTYAVENNIDKLASSETLDWHQYVVVHGYQGIANKGAIFVDGVLSVMLDRPTQLTTTGTNFSIGKEFDSPTDINVYMDDFQIYNVALTDNQIQTLYTTGSLSTPNSTAENLNFSIYPNPASDSITIDMETELKTVEIYSIHGQKIQVTTSKVVLLNNLPAGMYLVKIKDINEAIAVKKLIIQ